MTDRCKPSPGVPFCMTKVQGLQIRLDFICGDFAVGLKDNVNTRTPKSINQKRGEDTRTDTAARKVSR